MFDEGRKLLDDGKYADACDKFTAAIQLDPEAPGTMLNLGECNEKLTKIAEALTWYKKAEEHARTYKMTEYERRANEKARALEARVPVVKLEFEAELPAGGQVMFDGKPLPSEDSARFVADPGKHEIVITAPHVRRFEQSFELVEGAEKTVKVDKWVETHVMTRDAGRSRRHLAYAVAGGAVARYAADIAIGLHYKSDYNDHGCSDTVHTPACNERRSRRGRCGRRRRSPPARPPRRWRSTCTSARRRPRPTRRGCRS